MKYVPPAVRGAFYDSDAVSRETALVCPDQSLTVQSELEESDINTIVRRFGLSGKLPENVRVPSSGDFTGVSDYHEALNLLNAADDAFMTMPAEVRARFNHDAGSLIEFMENPANLVEARSLGLVVPAADAAVAPAAVAASAA